MKIARLYGDRGLKITRGYMQYLWDKDENKYLDYDTGHGTMFLGHSNPRIVRAVTSMFKLLQVPGSSYKTEAQEYALKGLEKIAPRNLDTVLFQNSGAEAVEAALKMAWAYTGKKKIIAFKGSFHGRTLGALSATWSPKYRRGFPVIENIIFAPYNSSPSTLEEYFKDTQPAAVILEIVQGEGGVNPANPEFLKHIEELAQKHESLLIIDEVQTGAGRTGKIWSHQHYNLKPDIVTAGKAIGGGYPVSLVFTREEIAKSLQGGRHGSTYAGNPVALAAVGTASRIIIEDNVPGKAREHGDLLKHLLNNRLRDCKSIREIRGLGSMIGVELRYKPTPVLKCMQEKGVLALKAGLTVVRLLPPYMAGGEDHEHAVEALGECITRIYGC